MTETEAKAPPIGSMEDLRLGYLEKCGEVALLQMERNRLRERVAALEKALHFIVATARPNNAAASSPYSISSDILAIARAALEPR